MAYISQENKKVIAANIKPILKKYGIKATLSIHNHSTIHLNVKSGKIDFGAKDREVSEYHMAKNYSGVALEFLNEANAALRSAGWYDKSDIMTDYFNTAYYYYIKIGKYNKPYILEI